MNIEIKSNENDAVLIEQYANIFRDFHFEFIEKYSKWEKQGDNYKQYSLYDTNIYETSTSYGIVNN